jgi:hypothetical protein
VASVSDVPPEQRRSRLGWILTTEPTTTPAGTHDHQLKHTPLGMAFLGILLLFLVNVGLVAYVIVAKQNRDAAQEQVQREIRDSWCQALDGFPQGNPFLDPLRKQYHCGPGMPITAYPPEVQNQLRTPAPTQPSAPVPAQPTVTPRAAPEPSQDASPAPVQPSTPDSPAPLPGGADGPMSPSEPPPLSPPSQVRELVCDLLPVCEGVP